MNQLNIKIGNIIRQHRQLKQVTQLELAKKLGYDSTQFISLFERGLSKCPTKILGKLCTDLKINKRMVLKIITDDFYMRTKSELEIDRK